jgi:hypothetical protein
MIHIITNHHETLKWLTLQSQYLARNTAEDYKVYCGVTSIKEEPKKINNYHYDKLEGVINRHADKLNYLSNLVTKVDDDDLLVFLDPDALLIRKGWESFIRKGLVNNQAVAISREENIEPLLREDQKPYPHPCFFATTVKFWKENKLSWDLDPSQGASCAGVLLKNWFDITGNKWAKLLRTNCFDLHPLNFGIYGNIIYHHGSGNRPIYDSIDVWCRPGLSTKYGVSLDLHWPELLKFNQKISDLVFNEIVNDEKFISMYFAGKE